MSKQKKFVQHNNPAIGCYRNLSHAQNEASIKQRETAEKYTSGHGFYIVMEYGDAVLSSTSDDRPQ